MTPIEVQETQTIEVRILERAVDVAEEEVATSTILMPKRMLRLLEKTQLKTSSSTMSQIQEEVVVVEAAEGEATEVVVATEEKEVGENLDRTEITIRMLLTLSPSINQRLHRQWQLTMAITSLIDRSNRHRRSIQDPKTDLLDL
jgi:hypothetical protein